MFWLTLISVHLFAWYTTFVDRADAYCNQGWTQERGKCYRVFDTAVTWQQANRECDVLKSSLVTLNDIREQTFILQLRSTSADVNYWIGYNRNGSRWRWLNALNTSIYHLNTTNLHRDEDCAALTVFGIWNPTKCETQLPYVCESESQACMKTDGWFDFENKCLYLLGDPKSWTQARESCNRKGAELAILRSIYNNAVSLMHFGVTSWTWIGLKYDTKQSNYLWLDGTPSTSVSFQRSNDNECGAFEVNETSQLVLIKSHPCTTVLQGLCEKTFTPSHNTSSSKSVSSHTTSYIVDHSLDQWTTSERQTVVHTTTGIPNRHVTYRLADLISLLAQCLKDINTEQINDCLHDVFLSYDEICSIENLVPDRLYITQLYNIQIYKNFVGQFGKYIDRSLIFTLCKKTEIKAFVMIERIIEYSYHMLNASFEDSIQFYSDTLEIGIRRLQLPYDREDTVIFESYITGCLVNDVILEANSQEDVDALFAVINTDDVVQIKVEKSVSLPRARYYLVSPVLMVVAYRNKRKISIGHQFTLAYRTQVIADNRSKHAVFCAYYDLKMKLWSERGCAVIAVGTYSVVCRCNHTTSFGVIMKIEEFEISTENEAALSVITYIGCSVSMVTMFIALTVFTCIRSLNSERVFVHRNLCAAILCAQIVFLAAGKATRQKMICRVTAVVLHYCFLSIFTWMLVEGLHLYTKVVQVFGTDKSRNNYYLCFGWGLPLLLVLISSVADWEGYGTKTSCWLSIDRKTIWAFVGPAVAVIVLIVRDTCNEKSILLTLACESLVNFVILIMVLRVVVSSAKSDHSSKLSQTRAAIKAALFLLHLLGLTWIFGLLSVNRQMIAFEYIFSLSNSLQGFFVFLFHCALNTEVRQALRRVRERRAAGHEEIQTVSLSSASDTSSVTVEGTVRFRVRYTSRLRRCRNNNQNYWLKEEVNRECIKEDEDVTENTNGHEMKAQETTNKPLRDHPNNTLSLIYI